MFDGSNDNTNQIECRSSRPVQGKNNINFEKSWTNGSTSGELRRDQTASKVRDEIADVVKESARTFFTQVFDGEYLPIIALLVHNGWMSLFVAFRGILAFGVEIANIEERQQLL